MYLHCTCTALHRGLPVFQKKYLRYLSNLSSSFMLTTLCTRVLGATEEHGM